MTLAAGLRGASPRSARWSSAPATHVGEGWHAGGMSWVRRFRPPVRASSLLVVALLASLVGLAGCGSLGQPVAYPETGVDGLVVPTPTIEADAWAPSLDHPLLSWGEDPQEYALRLGQDAVASATVFVQGAGEVAGAPVTWVGTRIVSPRRWESGGTVVARGRLEWRDAYAQDRSGNVWWLAHESAGGSDPGWTAGRAGALAGLVMPAAPRVGDSYVHRGLGADEEAYSVVEETDATGPSSVGGLLVTRGPGFPSPFAVFPADADARRWFAPGIGLVWEERGTLVLERLAPQ